MVNNNHSQNYDKIRARIEDLTVPKAKLQKRVCTKHKKRIKVKRKETQNAFLDAAIGFKALNKSHMHFNLHAVKNGIVSGVGHRTSRHDHLVVWQCL